MNATKEHYIAARELLSDPDKWGRGHYYLTADGSPTDREHAERWCVTGAISHVANDIAIDALRVRELSYVTWQLSENHATFYNDHHTYEEVMHALDIVIDNFEAIQERLENGEW